MSLALHSLNEVAISLYERSFCLVGSGYGDRRVVPALAILFRRGRGASGWADAGSGEVERRLTVVRSTRVVARRCANGTDDRYHNDTYKCVIKTVILIIVNVMCVQAPSTVALGYVLYNMIYVRRTYFILPISNRHDRMPRDVP